MGGHTIGSRVTMLGGRLPCRVDGSRKGGAILLICFPLDVQKRINLSFLSTAAPGTLAKWGERCLLAKMLHEWIETLNHF